MREFRLRDPGDVQRRVEELLDALDVGKMEELLDVYFCAESSAAATSPVDDPSEREHLSRMRGVRAFMSWVRSVAGEIAERRDAEARMASTGDGSLPATNAEDMTTGLGMRERRSGHRAERFLER